MTSQQLMHDADYFGSSSCESPKWCVVELRGGGKAATVGDWPWIKEFLVQVTPSNIKSVRMGFMNINDYPAT